MSRIDKVCIIPYELALRDSWSTARGSCDHRNGWLIEVHAEGLCGYGDCAPFPLAGTESYEEAQQMLDLVTAQICDLKISDFLLTYSNKFAQTPAVNFGLECACLDIITQSLNLPLRTWLNPNAVDRVPVNAMLGSLHTVTPQVIQSICEDGFTILKVKIGLEDLDTELSTLTTLSDCLPPKVYWRLDANGAWSFAEARRFLLKARHLPIESLEEPLHNPDLELLLKLQTEVPFSLARDESLINIKNISDLMMLGVRRIVLKPAVFGSLQKTLQLAENAQKFGLEVVITSLFESAAGLWPTIQLAAASGSKIPHGLSTAAWLSEDLGVAPRPNEGHINLSSIAGTGFKKL